MTNREQEELFLGIDFGTSKTCLAYCTSDQDDVSIFEDDQQQSRFPTVVGRTGGKDSVWITGEEARYDSSGGKAIDSIKMRIDDQEKTSFGFTNVQLAGKFLAELRAKFRERLNNPPIVGLTITIPAKWSISKRQATLFAARLAGFDCPIALLEEPLAAFLRFYKKNQTILKQHQNVLVVDFGGGTCDLSLIQFADGKPRVQKSDTINLGGGDIDTAITRYWLARYTEETKKKISETSDIFQKLRFEAESSKRRLCQMVIAQRVGRKPETLDLSEIMDKGRLVVPNTDINLSLTLSALELKTIIEKEIIGITAKDELIPDKVAERLIRFLNQNDQGKSVSCVIFSGGTCRAWAIQDYLRDFLHRRYGEKISFLPSETEEGMMDQSVAVGAALSQYFASEKNPIAIPTLIQNLRVTIRLGEKVLRECVFKEGENLPTGLDDDRTDYFMFAQNKPIQILIEEFVENEYKYVSMSKPFLPDEKMSAVGVLWWACRVNEYGLVNLTYGTIDVLWVQSAKQVSLYPAIEGFNLSDKQMIHEYQKLLGIYKE